MKPFGFNFTVEKMNLSDFTSSLDIHTANKYNGKPFPNFTDAEIVELQKN